MSDVTQLLHAIDAGDPTAADQLLPLVYRELRNLAAARLAQEKAGHTLQPTALVHEAWLKIAGDGGAPFANRRHFFKAAATAMQQILVDDARRKQRVKIAEPEARAAFLQETCGQNVTLRRQVEELLKEHFSNDSFLAGPALEAGKYQDYGVLRPEPTHHP